MIQYRLQRAESRFEHLETYRVRLLGGEGGITFPLELGEPSDAATSAAKFSGSSCMASARLADAAERTGRSSRAGLRSLNQGARATRAALPERWNLVGFHSGRGLTVRT